MHRLHRKTVVKQSQKQNLAVKKIMQTTILKMVKKTISPVMTTAALFAWRVILLLKILSQKTISGKFLFLKAFQNLSLNMLILLFQTV